MPTLLRTLDRWLGKFEYTLLALLTGLLTLILTAQVILRYFFNSPLFWAEEVAVQILISATFIGVSYLIHTGRLVRVDFLILLSQGALRHWGERALDVVGLLTLIVLCYFATDWIMRPEVRADLSPTTQLPRWYNYAVLVVAFYTMAFHMLIRVIWPEGTVSEESA
ncbi:MAG: TRAP transporter small permease [Gammaproteobacteria bacterium]|nr:TRAP transporter small permease [Gammaproteobacteria bacterium]